MKKIDNYWIDENNNKWDCNNYNIQEAEILSKSLIDCYNCINCTDCTDCVECIDCNDCSYCIGCIKCTNCNYCSYCNNCSFGMNIKIDKN